MTPLSLVGMTMGARKRAASLLSCDWPAARARYRIGEHLRPCLLCPKCRPDLRWETAHGMVRVHDEDCGRDFDESCRCVGLIRFVDDYCDGSGVLPAKRSVKP